MLTYFWGPHLHLLPPVMMMFCSFCPTLLSLEFSNGLYHLLSVFISMRVTPNSTCQALGKPYLLGSCFICPLTCWESPTEHCWPPKANLSLTKCALPPSCPQVSWLSCQCPVSSSLLVTWLLLHLHFLYSLCYQALLVSILRHLLQLPFLLLELATCWGGKVQKQWHKHCHLSEDHSWSEGCREKGMGPFRAL